MEQMEVIGGHEKDALFPKLPGWNTEKGPCHDGHWQQHNKEQSTLFPPTETLQLFVYTKRRSTIEANPLMRAKVPEYFSQVSVLIVGLSCGATQDL